MMNETVKKYLNAFKNAELNQTTQDVDADIKHLNLQNKFKHYGYYITVISAGLGLYFGALHNIESSDFRKNLIEVSGVSPVLSLFYNDFSDELKRAQKEEETTNQKVSDLKKKLRMSRGYFNYSYDDFLKDLKFKKIVADIDLKNAISKYKQAYFLSYLIKNKDGKLSLGSNEYSYLDISRKVARLNKKTALEKLVTPANILVKKLNIPTTDDNVKTLSNALYILSKLSFKNKIFYSKMEKLEISDIKQKLEKALFDGKKRYEIKSESSKTKVIVKLPSLWNEYKKQKEKQKEIFKMKQKQIADKKEKIQKTIRDLTAYQQNLNKLVNQIDNLKNDFANYEKNKMLIEKTLGALKWS